MWQRVHITKHSSCSFLSCHFIHFSPDILISTLFVYSLTLCPSLHVRDQVSHPCKTRGKIMVSCILISYIFRQQVRQKVLNWIVPSITWIQFPDESNLHSTCFILASFLTYSSIWRGRHHDSSKCHLIFNGLQGVNPQNIELFKFWFVTAISKYSYCTCSEDLLALFMLWFCCAFWEQCFGLKLLGVWFQISQSYWTLAFDSKKQTLQVGPSWTDPPLMMNSVLVCAVIVTTLMLFSILDVYASCFDSSFIQGVNKKIYTSSTEYVMVQCDFH
jgi:hypothetical protein